MTHLSDVSSRRPEAELWGAVLWQVLVDLGAGDSRIRRDAEDWIGRRPSRDFIQVCDLIGLEPARAHGWFQHVVDTPPKDRRAFGNGTRGPAGFIRPKEPPPETPVTSVELGRLLGVTPQWIRHLARDGQLEGCFFETAGKHRRYLVQACAKKLGRPLDDGGAE